MTVDYFIINLHEIIGPGRDRTRDPWNYWQTRICSQTRHVTCILRYADRSTLVSAILDPGQLRSNVGCGLQWYGSKRFGNAISRCKTSPLVRKKLNSICIAYIHMNSLWLFGLHIRKMHSHQSSGVRGRLHFLSLCCSHISVIIYKCLAYLYVKCEATKNIVSLWF